MRGREVWMLVRKGREGILLGAISGLLAYYVVNGFSPATFSAFSLAPSTPLEQAMSIVVPYKPQIMMVVLGAFIGWLVDVLDLGRKYLVRLASWLKH